MPERILLFDLGQYAVGWDNNPDNWDDGFRWLLFVGFIFLSYCAIALCCIMAGRCSKGGRNREVHTNEQIDTYDATQRRVKKRAPSDYEVVEDRSFYDEPVVST